MPDLPILPDGTDWGDAQLTPILNFVNALPRGRVAYSVKTAAQGGIGVGPTDLTSLSVTFTAEAGRRYRTTVFLPTAASDAVCLMTVTIADAANVALAKSIDRLDVGGGQAPQIVQYVEVPGAGAKTRKARFGVTSGAGAVTAAADAPAFILVEDIGT